MAAKKWEETAEVLQKNGLLTDLDLDTFAMYCDAFQELHDATELLEREGEFIHTEKGGVLQHPAAWKRNKALERIRRLGSELGLSPNARRGLDVKPPGEQDALTAFVNRRPPAKK